MGLERNRVVAASLTTIETISIISSFDWYIVGPKHDSDIRRAFSEKISQAGRDPIKPLPADEDGKDTG